MRRSQQPEMACMARNCSPSGWVFWDSRVLKYAARSKRTSLEHHHKSLRAKNLALLPRKALSLFGESQGEERPPRVEGARREHLRLRRQRCYDAPVVDLLQKPLVGQGRKRGGVRGLVRVDGPNYDCLHPPPDPRVRYAFHPCRCATTQVFRLHRDVPPRWTNHPSILHQGQLRLVHSFG